MIFWLLASALASPTAHPAVPPPDGPVDVRADAFRWESGAHTARVDGLHRADVDLDAFAAALTPVSQAVVTLETPDGTVSLPVPKGDLVIENDASGWQELDVMGTHIGRIGPYGVVTIRDVPVGAYTVLLTGPTGFARERTFRAASPEE